LRGELRHSRFEIEAAGASRGDGIFLGTTLNYAADLMVLHCYVRVDNDEDWQHGIRVSAPTIAAHAYVEHTTFEHQGTNAQGYDLEALQSHAVIYVRANRYSTWNVSDGGQIIPLAGDRPRLAGISDNTAFTITAGAGTWQNDPTGVTTIDLPCESDLKIEVAINWKSDAVRNFSLSAQVWVDGAVPLGLGYLGCHVADSQHLYSFTNIVNNLAAGLHTIVLQVARFNAADTIILARRQITVMSDPWP